MGGDRLTNGEPDFAFEAQLWRWQADSPSAWHFLTLPEAAAAEIRLRSMGHRKGFGSVRVRVAIGGHTWLASVFPDKRSGSYVLPVKASVRRAEGVGEGDMIPVSLSLVDV